MTLREGRPRTDPVLLADVHCHVHGQEFDTDRAAVLHAAGAAGVGVVLAMGEGFQDNQRLIEVAREHTHAGDGARLVPCLGLHPDRAGREPLAPVIDQIRTHAAQLAAIGEVGLDYWVAKDDNEARTHQRDNLTELAALARELDLPLSVHSRSAGHHTLDLLRDLDARRVCMHAFDGAARHAARAADEGYMFSVPPSVVRSPQKQKMVRRLPLSALLLETDAPVLGPDRETRNVPANVRVAAQAIADLKGLPLQHVLEVTSDNAWTLFRLDRWL